MKEAAQGAVDYAAITGKSIDQASDAFIRLQGDPIGVIKEMDKQLHFLTLTQYENIRALQERGDVESAAAIAQKIAADAVRDRTSEVRENLSWLERGWKDVSAAAKDAWGVMANAGRTTTNADDFEAAERELKRLRESMHVDSNTALLNSPMSSFARRQV